VQFGSHLANPLTSLDKTYQETRLGFAASPPDVRKVSDPPKSVTYLSWGYAPNSLGHSPKFGSNCPAAGGAKPPPHIGQLSREMP